MPLFIDSHAHLEGAKFDADRADVLVRAQRAGVACILAIGSGAGPGTYDCALRIARQHDWIYATVGLHPHEAQLAAEPDYAEMEQVTRDPKVIAWGEIGLDYFYDHSPRDVQKQVFIRQMELAAAAKLPVIIHCRPSQNSENAWDDTLRLLGEHWAPTGLPGILHCFTGEWRHAKAALDIGFYISFAGNVSFPKAENIRDAARETPQDRILIETDSPFLAPVPMRGKRNEPAFLVQVAEHVAAARGTTAEEVGSFTTENFYRLFAGTRE